MTSIREDLVELGLVRPQCSHITGKGRRCGQEVEPDSDRCVYHGGAEVPVAKLVASQREEMMRSLLPLAVMRLEQILLDPMVKEEVVVRAAFGLMDRIGLGPVSGLAIEAKVEVGQTPSELLLASLARIAERLHTQDATERELSSALPDDDVVDAEVVGEEGQSA